MGISNLRTDPLTADSRLPGIGVLAGIGAPIRRDGRWHAGLYVHHREPRQWRDGDLRLVREVAELTWDAVERDRAMPVGSQRDSAATGAQSQRPG